MAQDKFGNFVHYVCSVCETPSQLSETKLQKALWFVDTYAYRKFGSALSGGSYRKEANGPVPRQLTKALSGLANAGLLSVRTESEVAQGLSLYDFKPGPVHISLSEEKRQLVRAVVNKICTTHTDKSISELSHDEIWESVEIGEEMPVAAVLAANAGEITEEDEKWAQEEIAAFSQEYQEELEEKYGEAS